MARAISDLKARLKKGQTVSYIAHVYNMTDDAVGHIMRSMNWINPSINNLEIVVNMPHGKHYDITEQEIINGYTPPRIEDLRGEELEILNGIL